MGEGCTLGKERESRMCRALQLSYARFCGYHDDVNWLTQSLQNNLHEKQIVAGIPGGSGTCFLPRKGLLYWSLASCNSSGNPKEEFLDSQLVLTWTGSAFIPAAATCPTQPGTATEPSSRAAGMDRACGDHSRWKSKLSWTSKICTQQRLLLLTTDVQTQKQEIILVPLSLGAASPPSWSDFLDLKGWHPLPSFFPFFLLLETRH